MIKTLPTMRLNTDSEASPQYCGLRNLLLFELLDSKGKNLLPSMGKCMCHITLKVKIFKRREIDGHQ